MKAEKAAGSITEKLSARQFLLADDNPLVAILQNLPDAVVLIDDAGEVFYSNDKAENLFGFAKKNIRSVRNIIPENSALQRKTRLLRYWRTIENSGSHENFETELINSEGETLDASITGTAIFDSENKMRGFSAVIKDVTKTKESEKRIERRNNQLFALVDVADAITQMAGVQSFLERTLDAVLRVTSLTSGCVHLIDEDDECLKLTVWQNLLPKAVKLLNRYEIGEGIIGGAAVFGETMIVSDTTKDRRVSRPVAKLKIASLAAVPLVGREGAVRGILTLINELPRNFTEHESSMLTAIGKQIGVALEQSRLLGEVTDSRREWEETFEAMTDGVSIHAPSGKIRRANESLAKMFGKDLNELVGIRCCELYHNSKKPRANCTIMRTITERQPQKVEIEDRAKGRILRVITDPIITEGGRIAGVVCTTRDVTDEKLIERRLIQQERISAIGEIAAGIAHEVGTPLNIISANVEFLLRGNSTNSEEELSAIHEQAQNITALVRQLLDFSRDSSPEFAPVNVNHLIEKTIGLLNHQLQKTNIKTKLNLVQYLPTVDGDASQLQQVLFNLITNARQAMENVSSGERRLQISTDTAFSTTEEFPHPHIVIKIVDFGRGISDEDLPNVFNPFFTANKEGGTGLGLAISLRIVQRHSGLLTIENNPRGGCTARIKLPLSQID